jgi:hypothetical protein
VAAPETNGDEAGELHPQRRFRSVERIASPGSGRLDAPSQDPFSTSPPPPDADATLPAVSRAKAARNKQPPRSPAPRRTRRGAKTPSVKGQATSNPEHTALGPVQPSKVSKPRKMGGGARPRQANAAKEAAEAGPSAQAPDGPAGPPQDADTPRRSRRLQAADDRTPTDVKVDGKQSNGAPRRTKRTSARVAKQSAPANAQQVTKGRTSRRR